MRERSACPQPAPALGDIPDHCWEWEPELLEAVALVAAPPLLVATLGPAGPPLLAAVLAALTPRRPGTEAAEDVGSP
jgi:hypothetical protein